MTTDPIFGPLVSHPDVEAAVLTTLRAWVPFMLRVLERRHGFRAGTLQDPPGASSYIGGLDFETWTEDFLPMVIAVVNPTGQADRGANGINQMFEVEVAALVAAQTEDEARARAGYLGTAVMAALAQHGDLGGLASHTEPIGTPKLEFPDPNIRVLVRARTTFESYVTGLVDSLAGTGTATPAESPEMSSDPSLPSADWPAHSSTHVVVDTLS